MVFGVVGIDTGHVVVIVGIVGIYRDEVVAAVHEGGAYYAALAFTGRTVEREEYLVAVLGRIAQAVLVLDDELSLTQAGFDHLCLGCPGAVEVCAVYTATTYWQKGIHKPGERNGFLLAIGYVSPALYHVHIAVCEVVEGDCRGIDGIVQGDGEEGALTAGSIGCMVAVWCERPAGQTHVGGEVAVGVTHGEATFLLHVGGSVGRIDLGA